MRRSFGTSATLSVLLCATLGAGASSCVKMSRRVDSVGGQSTPPVSHSEAAGQPPRININTASRNELEELPGIGQGLAARIIEHRERYGRFRRAEHLLLVRGISDRHFRRLRRLVKVE